MSRLTEAPIDWKRLGIDPAKIEETRAAFLKEAKEEPGRIEVLRQQGYRDDSGKLPIHLIPVEALEMVAEVFRYGAFKYAPRNWEKGMDYSRMYSSAMRHLLAFWGGEDEDLESGLPHMAHAAWNCLCLLQYCLGNYSRFDDRPGFPGGRPEEEEE